MKIVQKAVEVSGEGLESLLGTRVQLWCMNYIYAGVLAGVNDKDVKLEQASVVYETGVLTGAFKDAQSVGDRPLYVRTAAIESYGPAPE